MREGPSLESAHALATVVVDDLASDERWPRFAKTLTTRTPVRSIVSVQADLGTGDQAALTLLASHRQAFDEWDVGVAAALTLVARLVLQNDAQRTTVNNLREGLDSNRRIGVAIGIVMATELVVADEAFQRLRTASQQSHKRVRDIAEEVILTGQLGPPEPRRQGGGGAP